MKLRTEGYFREIASRALAAVGATEPPVPIEEIVASLCIPVRFVSLPPFFTAATVYEDGMPVMVVNALHPEIQRRHALAHMLGHVLLVLADEGDAYPRADRDHSSADTLARELIMPATMVVEQSRLWFNDARYLARLFGVNEGEMLDRMREMRLVRSQGGTWER